MCEFCDHHKPLLTYHYDSIYTEIKLINKTQLDTMTTVTDQRGKTTSVGQSNTPDPSRFSEIIKLPHTKLWAKEFDVAEWVTEFK